MSDVKLNKKRCKSGLDGMNLEYKIALDGMDKLYLEKEVFKNKNGNTIVEIDCVGGKVKVYVNAVNGVRPNNVKPIGVVDAIKLELVQPQVIEFIKGYLQKHLQNQYSDDFINKLKVTAIEMNTTLKTSGNATPSDLVNLFDRVLDRTVVFRKRKVGSKCGKDNTSCLYSKPKEYRLKIYDKTEEQHEKGNPLVEKNLLRIETVFIDRSLNRMFGEKRMLSDILTKKAIVVLCTEYKRVLTEDISNAVRTYRDNCKDILVESLTQSSSGNVIADTVMKHKELIVDNVILKKALQKYYSIRNMPDSSSQALSYYRKKGILPQDVFKTFKTFQEASG